MIRSVLCDLCESLKMAVGAISIILLIRWIIYRIRKGKDDAKTEKAFRLFDMLVKANFVLIWIDFLLSLE